MFIVCGEALFDVFVTGDTPNGMGCDARIGGSPFTVAPGLARLGQPAGFLGGIGTGLTSANNASRACYGLKGGSSGSGRPGGERLGRQSAVHGAQPFVFRDHLRAQQQQGGRQLQAQQHGNGGGQ